MKPKEIELSITNKIEDSEIYNFFSSDAEI
jgi:hypothetical protein